MKLSVFSVAALLGVIYATNAFAVRLILPGELSKHAISEGTKSVSVPPKSSKVAAPPKK